MNFSRPFHDNPNRLIAKLDFNNNRKKYNDHLKEIKKGAFAIDTNPPASIDFSKIKEYHLQKLNLEIQMKNMQLLKKIVLGNCLLTQKKNKSNYVLPSI
jgi:hypothetical protein